MTTNSISTALTKILGSRGGEESYDKLFEGINLEVGSLSTVKDTEDAKELSDVELQEIALKITQYVEDNYNSLKDDPDRLRELNDIVKAINEFITHDDKISADEGDDVDYNKYKDAADLALAIHKDVEDDGTIDDTLVKRALNSRDELPKGFATLSADEQLAILEFYPADKKDELLQEAVDTLSPDAIADLLAESVIEGSDISFDTIFDKIPENKLKDVTIALLDIVEDSPEGMSDSHRTTIMEKVWEQGSQGDKKDWKKRPPSNKRSHEVRIGIAEILENREGSAISDRFNRLGKRTFDLHLLKNDQNQNNENGVLNRLSHIMLDFKDPSSSLHNSYYLDYKNAFIGSANPDSKADKLADSIINKANSNDELDLNTFLNKSDSNASSIDIINFTLDDIDKLTPSGLTDLVNAFKDLDDSDSRKDQFFNALKDHPQASLYLADNSKTLLQPTEDGVKAIKDELDEEPPTIPSNSSIIDLGYAYEDASSDGKKLIIEAMLEKAASGDSDNIQELLLVFNNIPELEKMIDNILENNSDHPLANLLDYEGKGYVGNNTLEDLGSKIKEFIDSDFDREQLSIFFVDAEDSTPEEMLSGPVGDFQRFMETLPIEGEDPAESISRYFQANPDEKNQIFDALADGNSELYENEDGDVRDIMNHFWAYLEDKGSSEQKDFLGRIEAYSPIHLSILETVDELRETDGKSKYFKALEKLADGITKGSLSGVNLKAIFPNDRSDMTISEVVEDIFGHVSEIYTENANSENIVAFINGFKDGTLDSTQEMVAFINNLSIHDLAEFSAALTSDESPLLALFNDKDGGETLEALTSTLFEALADSDVDHNDRLIFLESIDPSSNFFEYIEDIGASDIAEAIEDGTLGEDFTPEELQDFISNDLRDITKSWYSSQVTDEYLDELATATTTQEIRKILDNADDEGVLDELLYLVASDKFDNASVEFYNAFFKHLRNNKTEANVFMSSIDPRSNLGRTLTQLADRGERPFHNIDYSIDKKTGMLDFGNDARDIIRAMGNGNMVGANIFYNLFTDISAQYDGAEGSENRNIIQIIEAAQSKSLSNSFFDDIFDVDNPDKQDDAEELLSIILDDDNIIFKDLNQDQLQGFVKQFTGWLRTQDDDGGLLDAFAAEIDEDSIIYRALILAGGDPEDLDSGEPAAFLRKATRSDDAAKYIEQSLQFEHSDYQNYGYVNELLRGTTERDIQDAVDNILFYASADSEEMNGLIAEVLSGGEVLTLLTEEQSEKLIKAVFDYVDDERPESGEHISEAGQVFIENLDTASDFLSHAIRTEYPILADYAGLSVSQEDLDYDDRDVARELDKFLRNGGLIKAYAQRSNGQNEQQVNDPYNPTSGSYPPSSSSTGSHGFVEDDGPSSYNSGYNSSNANQRAGIISDTGMSDNSFNSGSYQSTTDAALAALGRYMNVTGEPDIQTGTFSPYFFEEYTISDLAGVASKNRFDARTMIGIMQMIPLEGQLDFIREMLAMGVSDPEVRDFLLGRLLIMVSQGEVGQRTLDNILDDVGIPQLTDNVISQILDGWAEAMDRYTNIPITAIDNTYEAVESKLASALPEDASQLGEPTANPYVPQTQQGHPQSPWGMDGYMSNPYGMNSPYGMNTPYGGYGSAFGGYGGYGAYGSMGGFGGFGGYGMPQMMAAYTMMQQYSNPFEGSRPGTFPPLIELGSGNREFRRQVVGDERGSRSDRRAEPRTMEDNREAIRQRRSRDRNR